MRGNDVHYTLYRGEAGGRCHWLLDRTEGQYYRLTDVPRPMQEHVCAQLEMKFPAVNRQDWTMENIKFGASNVDVALFARTDRDKRLTEVSGCIVLIRLYGE
jgi:hypothetical protein